MIIASAVITYLVVIFAICRLAGANELWRDE